MKRTLICIASLAVAAALTGCNGSAPTVGQVNQTVAAAATLVANGCKVVQPTLAATALATANPDAALAAGANGVFCAAQGALATSAPAAASAPAASK